MLEFQPFLIEHKEIIDQYVRPHGFYCSELTFTNMIIWGQDDKIQWAEQDDVLYVRLTFGSYPMFMFPPVMKDWDQDYKRALDGALEYFYAQGEFPRFRSVSGQFVPLFRKHAPQFTLSPERDTFDYVYRVEDLLNLAGRKYHSKRNHIHQFTSQYEFEYQELSPQDSEECMELYLSWLSEKDVLAPGILGEMNAIRFLLPNMDKLGVRGAGIRVGGKLVAFTIGEQINSDAAVIHIEKADASYMGLYAVINQQFVKNTWSHLSYINREEDMGILGMRKAKLSYRPAFMVEKFDAVLRP
ncbi:phosphatidylglycerol lysyltransferase domain-containing protein [Eubacteriales bacterium OttesenSCG-928-K08]|nr:phosphatidylglycerol lysyltransferase domain-containing protein [Eubacteriales bacterium OttesenSCG-928-K08]